MTIRLFYDRWPQYNRRLTEIAGAMSDEQLAIRPAPHLVPIWATVGHTAGTRTYWLCGILGELDSRDASARSSSGSTASNARSIRGPRSSSGS